MSHAQQLSGINIFSDSRFALQAICKGRFILVINIFLLEQVNCLHKYCVLQWIPAHIDLEYNEIADSLPKNSRSRDQIAIPTSLANAKTYVKFKVITPSKIELKHQIMQFNIDRKTATTITRFRMKLHKHMKISTDGIKICQKCGNSTGVELTLPLCF